MWSVWTLCHDSKTARCVNCCSILDRHLALIVGLTAVLLTMKGNCPISGQDRPIRAAGVVTLSRHAWWSFLLDAESTPTHSAGGRNFEVSDKLQWSHREQNKRPSDLQRSATNKLSVGFHAGYNIAFENKNKNKYNTNLVTADPPISSTFHNSLCPVSAFWWNSETILQ